MFHTSSGWLRLWCQREEVALWETASRAPFLSKSWIDYLFHQQLNYQKLFSCCRFNHPPVFMSLFSKNVLILPLSTASASCAAVPQVCSQGAAILFSSFSSPRDQNTVQARCSEVCWRWNRICSAFWSLLQAFGPRWSPDVGLRENTCKGEGTEEKEWERSPPTFACRSFGPGGH